MLIAEPGNSAAEIADICQKPTQSLSENVMPIFDAEYGLRQKSTQSLSRSVMWIFDAECRTSRIFDGSPRRLSGEMASVVRKRNWLQPSLA
jgi:hypothetical protein